MLSIALSSFPSQAHTIGCGASGIEPLSTNHTLHLEKSLINYGSEGQVYLAEPPHFAEYTGSNHLPEVAHDTLSPNPSPCSEHGLECDNSTNIRPDCMYQSGPEDKARTPRWLRFRKKVLLLAGMVILSLTIVLVILASTHHLDRASSSNDLVVSNSSVPSPAEELVTTLASGIRIND